MDNQGIDILVVAETANGEPIALALELLGLARRLLAKAGGTVSVATLSDAGSALPASLIAAGADRVFVVKDAGTPDCYRSDAWLSAMDEVLANSTPRLILVGHTALGADLAPRLAFRLKAAVATGCERVTRRADEILVTRPCFGNKAHEVLALHSNPSIATVKARTNEPLSPDTTRRGEIVNLEARENGKALRTKVIEQNPDSTADGVRLETANVIVAGGRGLGGAEGFRILEQFASLLGGAVGASRVACDLGWCPHSWQIGLTGKTVTPDLYIAVGISGASHHMAGCGNAKKILAINADSEATIFKEADFGIVGDYKEIIPALIAEISRQPDRGLPG
jgi:electron transfer flavoprotein alpha subunit